MGFLCCLMALHLTNSSAALCYFGWMTTTPLNETYSTFRFLYCLFDYSGRLLWMVQEIVKCGLCHASRFLVLVDRNKIVSID